MKTDRRTALTALATLAATPAWAHAKPSGNAFPRGFLWGAATAGHQVEGNNLNADIWALEHAKPTVFAEPSADAVNSLELWSADLDIARSLSLNSYRFSLEWSRIEPEPGAFSQAMLDHYKAVITGCLARGLAPVVTFNHFTTPRWFAAQGGWTHPDAPAVFARFCDHAARDLHSGIAFAVTLNEPNAPQVIRGVFPKEVLETQARMLAAAARMTGSERFSTLLCFNEEDLPAIAENLLSAHRQGRSAIKAAASQLPVGVSLALADDEAVGPNSIRDRIRQERYGDWLKLAQDDDFIAVQNYNRSLWDAHGMVASPTGPAGGMGGEIYAPSLAGAVRYAHAASGRPVLITEHGVGTTDDSIRAAFIPEALAHLKRAMDDGVPVLGYIHWSLLDNYEWLFGYKRHFGLCSVDRTTFNRTAKPSAAVLAAIARRNAV